MTDEKNELDGILKDEAEGQITMESALDIAPNAWRANCRGCSRSFILYFPQDFWVLCPLCSNARKPIEEKV